MNTLKIIVVSGLPGSGKSTVAEDLAERLIIPIFSVDPIESAMLQSGIPKSFETGLAAYFVVEALAEEQLKRGLSVIIDAVSPVQEARDMWMTLARQHHATIIIIECVLAEDIHKQRIAARVRNLHGMPEVTWQAVEERRKDFLPWLEQRLIVDTSNPRKENLEKALEYVRTQTSEL